MWHYEKFICFLVQFVFDHDYSIDGHELNYELENSVADRVINFYL